MGPALTGFHFLEAYGILGGAFLAAASPLFLEDWKFQPTGILGWFAGIAVAVAIYELCPGFKLTAALLVPVVSLVGIALGAWHTGQRIRSNYWVPLMVSYFLVGLGLNCHLQPSDPDYFVCAEVFAVVVLLGVLQVATALVVGAAREQK